nr:hypothetical protein [Actinomyces sp.]
MTRVLITAPCQVDGEPKETGDEADVVHDGELRRLLHYGQAVIDESKTDGLKTATKTTAAKTTKEK